MRHLKNTKKFKRTEEERRRLWIDLCNGLILNGKITTFTARAKWFRPKFDRMVSLVKRAGEDKQLAYTRLRKYFNEPVARKMIEEVVPSLSSRNSGFTSIIKLHQDFSPHDKSMVLILKDVIKKEAKKQEKVEEKVK